MKSQNLDILAQLEHNIRLLIDRCDTLSSQNEALREQNERYHNEMMQTHAELVNLQREHRLLQSAYALAGNTEQRTQAKRQITRLIESIDKALLEMKPIS